MIHCGSRAEKSVLPSFSGSRQFIPFFSLRNLRLQESIRLGKGPRLHDAPAGQHLFYSSFTLIRFGAPPPPVPLVPPFGIIPRCASTPPPHGFYRMQRSAASPDSSVLKFILRENLPCPASVFPLKKTSNRPSRQPCPAP